MSTTIDPIDRPIVFLDVDGVLNHHGLYAALKGADRRRELAAKGVVIDYDAAMEEIDGPRAM